jgi:hypothetical protein
MLQFEHRQQKPISTREFVLRMLRSAAIAVLVTAIALMIGIAGYHWIGGLGWTDAFLNASMILGGMGPVDPMVGNPAKIFAGCYALFSGLVFIALAGFFIAPIAHRVLHHFHHIDDRES